MITEEEKQDLIGMDINDAEYLYADITIVPIMEDGEITNHSSQTADNIIPVETQDNIITRILD